MKRNLLLAGLILLISLSASSQQNVSHASNNSLDLSTLKKQNTETVVRIYPNPSYGKLTINAATSSKLHFYIFDLEGTLVYQAVLKNKDKRTITHLKKGTYLYDVFENDLSIEEGKIIIK